MLKKITIEAPAKFNPILRVGGKRSDGFHNLESLILKLSLCDSLTIELGADRNYIKTILDKNLSTHGNHAEYQLLESRDNLAFRAAELFLARKPSEKVGILLKKRIPLGAGLGGGSSDAAATLMGLSTLIPNLWLDSELLALAESLGSDVPALLTELPVLVSGRGEKVAELSPTAGNIGLSSISAILIKPEVAVNTKAAYGLLCRSIEAKAPESLEIAELGLRTNRPLGTNHLEPEVQQEPLTDSKTLTFCSSTSRNPQLYWADFLSAVHNDFQQPVASAYPEVSQGLEVLQGAGAARALLCGSGSSMIGLPSSPNGGRELANRVVAELPQSWFCCEVGIVNYWPVAKW